MPKTGSQDQRFRSIEGWQQKHPTSPTEFHLWRASCFRWKKPQASTTSHAKKRNISWKYYSIVKVDGDRHPPIRWRFARGHYTPRLMGVCAIDPFQVVMIGKYSTHRVKFWPHSCRAAVKHWELTIERQPPTPTRLLLDLQSPARLWF